MVSETFKFKPADVPQAERGTRQSKYMATVEKVNQFFEQHDDVQAVMVELGEVNTKSAVASFRNAIAKRYRDKLRLRQRGNNLYIERRS